MEPLHQIPILRNATYNSKLNVFMFLGYNDTNTLLNNATYFSLLYFELAVDTMLLCTLPKLDTLFGVSTQRPVCKYREKNCM